MYAMLYYIQSMFLFFSIKMAFFGHLFLLFLTFFHASILKMLVGCLILNLLPIMKEYILEDRALISQQN